MLLTKEVEIKVTTRNLQYWKEKGYKIETTIETKGKNKGKEKVKEFTYITVPVDELPSTCNPMVDVQCDYCFNIVKMPYNHYCNLRGSTYCCVECLKHKKKTRDENGNLIFIEVPYRNYNWLYTEYIEKKRSAPDIARECGINERTLRWWIDKLDIKNQKRRGKFFNREDLYRMYRIEKKTTKEIENYYGVKDGSALYYLHKFDIPIFTRTEILDIHYNEHGGLEKAREKYNTMENRILSSCRNRGISIEEFDGFRTTQSHMERNCSKYNEWRMNVFKRDNFTCQCCKKRGGDLNAHHLKNFSEYKELIYDIDNGITLCEKCHLENYPDSFHSRYGHKHNTPEQLREYINQRRTELGIDN